MLQELSIQNFAIISQLRIPFQEGMTVLTGETGAGKSIIIDAMSLLAGGRGSSDFIRQGAKSSLLEGIFEVPKQEDFPSLAKELGIELEDGYLVIQRDMYPSGKSVCRVNGRIVTLSNLRRIGEFLVDIQGQAEHQELMHQDRHLSLLDNFGTEAFKELKSAYRQSFEETKKRTAELQKLKKDEQSYVQRVDMLNFQKEEIETADLKPGEEAQLMEEREKLSNYQRIVDALSETYQRLTQEGQGAIDNVGACVQEVQEISALDKEYLDISENIQNAYYLLQDTAADVGRLAENLELDENRLEEVSQRLELIFQLKRKYGASIEEILSYCRQITAELDQSIYSDGKIDTMEAELAKKWQELEADALKLHEMRKSMAHKLEKAILVELKELYMSAAQFEVHFEKSKGLTSDGFDQVAFYLTTNPGEPLKPLAKVASGGELSRVMLALKTIFSKAQGITSIVFDEVDTGVSGRVAQAIADKIHKISEASQVLCITHLPQVAAAADHEYFISKEVANQRTETKVTRLDETQRIQEIARMLAGTEITALALEHAKELLLLARKK